MNGKKSKIFFIFLLVAAFAAGGLLFGRPKETPPAGKAVPGSTAQTIPLPPPVVAYLQNSLLYGNFYNENQKFVVYFTDMQPVYPSSFLPAVEQIKQNPVFAKEYAFLPRRTEVSLPETGETAADRGFTDLCGQFCIINPARGEIFYITGIGEEDSRELRHIFDALEQW